MMIIANRKYNGMIFSQQKVKVEKVFEHEVFILLNKEKECSASALVIGRVHDVRDPYPNRGYELKLGWPGTSHVGLN